MIILRQKFYSFGGFDWFFDDRGNLKSDLTEEDRRKFEAMQKRHPKEWEEFKRNGNRDRRSYRSSSSNSSSSNSGFSDYDDWFKKWNEDFKKQQEEAKRRQEEAKRKFEEAERQWEEAERKWKEDSKKRDLDTEIANKSNKIFNGTLAANVGKIAAKTITKSVRRDAINSRIGHNSKMKNSDRQRIERYKTLGSKEKDLLKDIAKDNENSKNSEKKYKARRVIKGALDKAITGAQFGSGIGNLIGDIETTENWRKENYGNSKQLKKTKVGLGIGAGLGAIAGGTYNAIKANKTIKDIKKSRNKQRELDRIKVGSGKMTENEFVKKHGGRE